MTATRSRGRLRSAVAALAILGVGTGGAALMTGGGPASADPVSLTLEYSCGFPLIGAQPLTVEINSDMPSQVQPGVPTGAFDIEATATVNDAARVGLRTVGATTLEGTTVAQANLSAPHLELPVSVNMEIPQVPIPATSGSFDVIATGSTPSLTFEDHHAGTGTISVGTLVLTMTPRDANGNETGLGTFESECTVTPGQDTVLHTFQIGGGGTTTTAPSTTTTAPSTTTTAPSTTMTMAPPALEFSFDLAGQSVIRAANGTVPINGHIDADFDLASGTYTADLTLAPTSGQFNILGFLNTTAQVEFEQVGDTTGSLVDGRLTSSSEMVVKLPSVNAFGVFPIGGGPDCRTVSPATVDMQTPAGETFNPLEGGNLTGTYTLPALQGCGFLNDLISLFTAGPDNTIDVTLTATD